MPRQPKLRKPRQKQTSFQNKKSIPLSQETVDLLQQQRCAFREKFGREPGPDDPIFFDPVSSAPKPITEQESDQMWSKIMQVAGKAGIDPALIYAMKKTGRIVTRENQQHLADEDLEEWNQAIDEYYKRVESGETQ